MAVEREKIKQGRNPDHNGNVQTDELTGHDKRADERRDAQDKEHIEDVASDDVTHREIDLARPSGFHADGHLGRARAVRDDREAHHERGEASAVGQGRSPQNEPVGSVDEKGETDEEVKSLNQHFILLARVV